MDVNQLTSFFMLFYEIENWNTLEYMDKKDFGLLYSFFYNHNNLPSKEKYQKMLDAYEK